MAENSYSKTRRSMVYDNTMVYTIMCVCVYADSTVTIDRSTGLKA